MVVMGPSSTHSTDHIHAASLPEDLVINEILPKLPVESLMRFKRVSKRWLDIITNDTRLVSSHLRHHSTTTKFSIILSRDFNSANRNCRMGLFLDESKVVESDISYISRKYKLLGIKGSSNGLVCVSYWDNEESGARILLWNPATRRWRKLPKEPERSYRIMGFGYDEHSKDYKLVRISEVYHIEGKRLCVQVFTTSSDSWREVKHISGYGFADLYGVGVVINGALYWLVRDCKLRDRVFSFDLHNEELRIMGVPDLRIDNVYPCHFRLTKWKDSLALLSFVNYNSKQWRRDVFVMRSNGIDKQIWTPLFRTLPLYPPSFFGVWRDRFLSVEVCRLNDNHTSSYFLVDPLGREENSWNKVMKVLESGWMFLNEAHDYVPSLVSVYPNQLENRRK